MNVTDYNTALAWLRGAKGQDEELSKDRSLYEWGGRIRLRLDQNTSVIHVYNTSTYNGGTILAYLPDGSYVIPTSYRTRAGQGFNRMIAKFTGDVINIVIRKGKMVIITAKNGKTDSKISKCRYCKGQGQLPYTCNGPGYDWRIIRSIADQIYSCISSECEVHKSMIDVFNVTRDEVWELIRTTKNDVDGQQKHQEYSNKLRAAELELEKNIKLFEHPAHFKCSHGYTANKFANADWNERRKLTHPRGDFYDCHGCNGSGKRDYGNKQTGTVWNAADALHIGHDGTYLAGI